MTTTRDANRDMTILIAGGGIGGLALALTCHQIGQPFKVFEAVRELKPLGVGINLQPSAVRELYDLGFSEQLQAIGVKTRDYGLYTKRGLHIWTEDRGTWAGYQWPQYSIHRGHLHMMLYHELIRRAGPDAVETGWSAKRFENTDDGALLHLKSADGETRTEKGALIVAADGIHSTLRKQMMPDEGEPIWGGTILWRGTTQAEPFLTGASMVLIGHNHMRFVSYPITERDPATGLATVNWIASLSFDPDSNWNKEDYSRQAKAEDFLPHFEDLKFDWLDAPALIRGSDKIFEYPMVDRDPLQRWTYDRVSLMGDAAHAAYPVGSNGAGSAIIDARKIGAAIVACGPTNEALQMYEDEMRPVTSKVVLTNRVAGPDKILDIVEKRCDGQFDQITDVISDAEMREHAETYKAIAGYGIAATNEAPPTIASGAGSPI